MRLRRVVSAALVIALAGIGCKSTPVRSVAAACEAMRALVTAEDPRPAAGRLVDVIPARRLDDAVALRDATDELIPLRAELRTDRPLMTDEARRRSQEITSSIAPAVERLETFSREQCPDDPMTRGGDTHGSR